ncbi:DUF1707 SHOCT-like domain-containing protein [Corynebacterium guangdongense]|uniref:DUF1707 domain-containing protein n=1 Tax=Corynebacterium guangdongense TaxID=1783348 RepID=A0ABU2A2E1_9CORY|nr:DUF1707 domain-containing protein [Corynebacterium guangdongense]MDR7330657.1 hypothetical protein [Corynebacterium guangdongense]WJZ16673.1 hypothetical protein CGUA_00320 [Corynebacterium guangdongense]
MDPDANLRAGDPERNAALDRLGRYFADGYLDIQEFDERTRRAAAAQTRGELAQLFVDLPVVPGVAASSELVAEAGAQGELDEVVRRNRRVQAIDGVIWSVTMITFFLGLFVLNWNYFWVVFPLAAFTSWGVRAVFRLDPEEEKVAKELAEKEKKERAERLRHAADKRTELGR